MAKKTGSKTKKRKNANKSTPKQSRAARQDRNRLALTYRQAKSWIAQTWTRRITTAVVVALLFCIAGMHAVAQWYINSHADEPYEIGATFIAPYAEFYDLDPQETFLALTDDLGFKRLRLVSYWNVHEPEPDVYDFSELDWQFEMAAERDVEVSLAIGLRQPRWPECHMPDWAQGTPKDEWYPELKEYMEIVINRYKDNPALVSYQLENEFLLEVFGECPDHDRERLIDEFHFVKSLDPDTPVIVSRSNNATPSWPIGEPRADKIGASIYKRVWDTTITKRYFEYPLPASFYSFLAGGAELTTGVDTVIHELQAEPWLPTGYDMRTAPTEELYKSMNPEMLRERFQYGRDTGIRELDMWGVEWWYYRKVSQDDDSFWEIAREELRKTEELNQQRLETHNN